MDILNKHEEFEMEVLEHMNSKKILESVVFGGGTMLRLCHDLNRYSADLDFWFLKKEEIFERFNEIKKYLSEKYELTDDCDKKSRLLYELRSPAYPRLLKVEIRKELRECDWQENIAYSRSSNRQVLLKTHTLPQCMKNKVKAALDRGEIRDFFDIEFLIRKGIPLAVQTPAEADSLIKAIKAFTPQDYKVKLGSILDPDARKYYVSNGFSFLIEKLREFTNPQ
jgi:predicted nucleotidyltransferase component of viral defense system